MKLLLGKKLVTRTDVFKIKMGQLGGTLGFDRDLSDPLL